MTSITEPPEKRLANFVCGLTCDDIHQTVCHAAKRAILNVLATLCAGSCEPAVEKALAVLEPHSAFGAAVLASRGRGDPLLAAFLNAMAANVHDFDDTHMPTILHPSAPVLPALLAAASTSRMTGAGLLAAFIAGVEVECRVGRAISPSHYTRGWHITSTCGVFGSAAATGLHQGLSSTRMIMAFASAAAQSSGMIEMLGTSAKSVSVGNAARGGLIAASLAALDFEGPPRPLTGKRGFLALFCEEPRPACLTDGLGETWEIEKVAFKPYPVGVVLNPVIDAALVLRSRGIDAPETIASVTFHGHPLLRERTDRLEAGSGRLSQVSAQHALTIALLRGRAGLAEFDDGAAAETMSRRPPCQFVDEAERDPSSVRLEVRLKNGEDAVIDIAAASGSMGNPMSDAAIEDKLRACAARAGLSDRTERLIEIVWNLEGLADVRMLADCCMSAEAS